MKIDDLGLHLIKTAEGKRLRRWSGERLLAFAPYLMKSLTIVGTAAMFLVGGGILAHGIPSIHHVLEAMQANLHDLNSIGPTLALAASLTCNGLLGILAGALLVPAVTGLSRLKSLITPKQQP